MLSLELEDEDEDPGDLMATPKKVTKPDEEAKTAESPTTPPAGASAFQYDASKFDKLKKAAEGTHQTDNIGKHWF